MNVYLSFLWACKYYDNNGGLIDDEQPCPNGDRCTFIHPRDPEWQSGLLRRMPKSRWDPTAVRPTEEEKERSLAARRAMPTFEKYSKYLVWDDEPPRPPTPPMLWDDVLPPALPRADNPRDFPYPYDIATYWDEDTLLFGANTTYPPHPTVDFEHLPIAVCTDGRWGYWEWTRVPMPFDQLSPHLAFMPVDPYPAKSTDIHFRPPRPSDRERDPSRPGYWRTTIEIHDVLFNKAHRRARVLDQAIAAFARVFSVDEPVDGEDKPQSILSKYGATSELARGLQYPQSARTRMILTLAELHYGNIRSWGDFSAVWHAHQRAVVEVEGFVYMCSQFLPVKDERDRLLKYVGHKNYLRRGVLLVNDADILNFYGFFREHGVPVFAAMWRQDYDVDRAQLRAVRAPWFSVTVDAQLDDVAQKEAPDFCYPPRRAVYEAFELIARGEIPREDEDKFVPSDRRIAVERKSSNKEQEAERQRGHALRKRPHTGGARYSQLPGMSKAMRSVVDMRKVPRPPYMPHPLACYVEAQQESTPFADQLTGGNKSQLSFFPPASVFWGVRPDRLVSFVLTYVRLLPSLLHRVRDARGPGSKIKPLGKKTWRQVLGGEYFRSRHWSKKKEDDPFYLEACWSRGDVDFFGEDVHRDIIEGKGISIGKLACGCVATVENVKGDYELIEGIIYSVNQLNLLYQFASLAQDYLRDFTEIMPIEGLRWPVFVPYDRDANIADPGLFAMRDAALGRDTIDHLGWAGPWNVRSEDVSSDIIRREHLLAMVQFFCSYADDSKFFDDRSNIFRACNAKLAKIDFAYIENLHEVQVEQLEADVLRRWFVACWRKGQWPCELYARPPPFANHCRDCRKDAGTARALYAYLEATGFDFDASDEDD